MVFIYTLAVIGGLFVCIIGLAGLCFISEPFIGIFEDVKELKQDIKRIDKRIDKVSTPESR